MHLEHSLALLYRQGFRIYSCMNSKVYTVEVEGTPITFVGPSDNRIIVPNRNKESELYYKIVAGLMFDHLDILIDDPIQIGSLRISRAEVWKAYDHYLEHIGGVVTNNSDLLPKEMFESNFVIEGEHSWDALLDYLETSDSLDHWDLAEFLTPTFKERLAAELTDRRMIKGATPVPRLF